MMSGKAKIEPEASAHSARLPSELRKCFCGFFSQPDGIVVLLPSLSYNPL